MIEAGLTAAAVILIIAVIMIIKHRRDKARRERHRQLEEQARIQSDRLREERAQQRLRTAEHRALREDRATVLDKNTYPRRTPGTDLGITTNPALLYGATSTHSDPSPSSSSSSYDGGSSSCDSGGGSF